MVAAQDRGRAADRGPNVILVMADQHKATSLGLYGNPDVRTPALEQLARRGVRYEWAFTPHPLCVPARASLWTGSYPHNHGVRTNELTLSGAWPNYLQSFQAAGYRTGLIGKNHCFDARTCSELDVFSEYMHGGAVGQVSDARDAKFRDWIDQPGLFTDLIGSAWTPLPADHCPAARIAEQATAFITADDSRPFLLWVSFPEPHEPYYAPEPFSSLYDPDALTLPPTEANELAAKPARQRVYAQLAGLMHQSEERIRQAVATYYASVGFVDAQMQRILNAVAAAGIEQDTIIVYVSDHGDFAGEHGLVVKCNAFYDCLTRVPLLVSWPGRLPEGATAGDLVSTIDVMPTLAALAGVAHPEVSRGRALPDLGLSTEPREAVFSEYGAGGPLITEQVVRTAAVPESGWRRFLRAREAEGRAKMIRTRDWKYIYDPTDADANELYDLSADPWELNNLARSTHHVDVVHDLRRRLLTWSLLTEDSTAVPFYYDPTTYSATQTAQPSRLSD